MTTIPARLAQTTRISSSLEEARRRSVALYRNFYRSAPEICALYALDVPPSIVRAKIRTKFEQNKNIKDLAVLDLMLLKAQQEYQETMNAWKQIPQVMKWFAEEEAPARPEGFLEKFYASRDEGRGPVGTGI
ncbi:putative NADH2 dehydrogenase [Testicularia cyperi]|uniref:Putative NADH2 dehydrogenase n=1 Tax=Testicularia cyperi TaxID=1882483 RepID=A0A317XKH5_9BASI|nr:putative NADH2 dehydrogenase [Testicularia cyperi]